MKQWSYFITKENQHLCNPDALDFLDKLLRYDHQERITAKEAMEHPYCASVLASAKRSAPAVPGMERGSSGGAAAVSPSSAGFAAGPGPSSGSAAAVAPNWP